MRKKVDIAIVGGGVVGFAIARELAMSYPEKKVFVVEKNAYGGMETSARNSGVLHSGIHQNPNFLKSKLAVSGSLKVVKYAKEKNIPLLDSGMLIVVSFRAFRNGLYREILDLFRLMRSARKQGIEIKFVTRRSIKKLAPNIKALVGIFIPAVWVISQGEFVRALELDALRNGAVAFFNSEVTSIEKLEEVYGIHMSGGNILDAEVVINAAGLYADDVAHMAGFDGYTIYPWRGEYYEIVGEKRNLVRRLVYPAVSKKSPSKGIHFSPRTDGRLFIGPNARSVPAKDYYEEDKTPVEVFLKHAIKYLPCLTKDDLVWAYSGIRAKITPDAEESDFIINVDSISPTFVNLIGIESPGLASAMAIAEYVHELLKTAR